MDNQNIEIFPFFEETSKLVITETQTITLTANGQIECKTKVSLQEPATNFSAFKDLLVLVLPSGLYTLSLQDSAFQQLLKGSFSSCSISSTHLGAVKSDGLLYVFGNLRHLSLKSGSPVALKANNLFVPRQIVCGKQFTVVSTCGGSVYLYGQYGLKPSRITDLNAYFINFLASSEEFFVCLSDSGVIHTYDSSGSALNLTVSNDFWVVSVACSLNSVVINSDSGLLACFIYEKNSFHKIAEWELGKLKLFSGFRVAVLASRPESKELFEEEEAHDKFQFSTEGFNIKIDPAKVEILADSLFYILKKNKNFSYSLAFEALKANDNYLIYYIYRFNTLILNITKVAFRIKYEALESIRDLFISSKITEKLDLIYKPRLKEYFLCIQLEYFKGCLRVMNENFWLMSEYTKLNNKKWAFQVLGEYQPRPKKNSISYNRLLLNMKTKKEKEISLLKNSMCSPKFPSKKSVFSVKSINNSPTYGKQGCATERRLEYSLKLTKKIQEKNEKKLSYDFKLNQNIFAYSNGALGLSKIFKGIVRRVFFLTFFDLKTAKKKIISKKNLQVSPRNSLFS